MDEIKYILNLSKIAKSIEYTPVNITDSVMDQILSQESDKNNFMVIYFTSICAIACIITALFGINIISQISNDYYLGIESTLLSLI